MKKKISYEEAMGNLKRMGTSYSASVGFELDYLRELFKKCDDAILYPYIPMRIVALMEGHFQDIYSNIIDADVKYRRNFPNLVKDLQFDLSVIDSFEKNTITFGEYASMLLPCNKPEDIISNIKVLLDDDDITKGFDGTTVLKDVKEIFHYRHIFCHEIAGEVILEKEQVLKMIEAASTFMDIIGAFVIAKLYPQSPNTTYEMLEDATREFKAKEKELHELIEWLRENVEEEMYSHEDEFLEVFEEYRRKRAECVSQSFEDGTYYGINYTSSMTEVTEELIAGLKKKYRYWLRRR